MGHSGLIQRKLNNTFGHDCITNKFTEEMPNSRVETGPRFTQSIRECFFEMPKNEVKSSNTVTSKSSEITAVSSDGLTSVTEKTRHVEIRTQNCDGEEKSIVEEQKSIVEEHGGSISERLAALQRSGSENWKKRLGGRPPILLKPDVPIMRVKERPSGERPKSLMDRIMMLGEAQDQWRNRVEDKDANQFTVAGKMVQMRYSPQASPIISRKKYSPKPVQSRSKTTNIQELSSYLSQSTPASPYHLSKSQSSLITTSSTSELEKITKVNTVSVPKIDDESFTSFFKSVKNRLNRISVSTFDISDEVFEFISSETHDLLSQRKEKLKIQRKHASSGNPLRLLASRSDLKQDYEEIYRGVAERELERMKIERLAKGSSLAMSALAGLASTEDFKNVALKKGLPANPASENKTSLLQIKGRRCAQVRLVEPKASSLNHGDSYVLVTPNQVYCWHGEFSNVIERVKAAEVANLVQSSKDLGFKGQSEVIVIEEENSSHENLQEEFFNVLSVKKDEIRAAGAPDEDELYEIAIVNTNAVYRLEENELKPCDEFCGAVPKIEMLKSDMIYVFDFGAEMYVWCGKHAGTELRKTAMSLAKDLWDEGYNYSECDINPLNALFDGPLKNQDSKRPDWATFMKTSQHREPVLFKEKFFDWPNIHPLITQKTYSNESNKGGKFPTSISDIKPCDAKTMLESEVEEPDTILENSHVGRGLEYHDEEERRHFRITSVSHKMWHISEHGYEVMPEESWGQFHNCDTYVVRWQYMISSTGRTLKGGASRYSFVGRKRWVYFFWQGINSPITEKGASALMTIELDEEKGPHVRVTCGKEPPCFLNMFRGQMIVYNCRRDDDTSDESNPYRLFMLRGNMKTEAVLQEVKLSKGSLRSRSSFLLVNKETGKMVVWHGCKSAAHTREFILHSAQLVVDNRPLEMKFDEDAELSLSEIEEGSEPEDFWIWSNGNDEPYYSLLKSELSYDFTPRLFLIDSMSGSLCAKEIVCPYFTKTHSCPFPLLQSDLKNASQPAFFLLDNNHEVFVWQGWLPSDDPESENNSTGSAKLRWEISRRLVMETTLQYCQGKNAEEVPKAFSVHAGAEPLYFTNIFPQWEEWDIKNDGLDEETSKVMFVQEVLSQLSRDRYSLQELQTKSRPPGVDLLRLESYLNDDEFEEVLGMKKEEFYNMPSWKQSELKKTNGLF
ncbi:Supervillin [Araneus ventricosus]|uniref:Supervillin n=1 Tax=Araneus ventricosus TaxID=182803 RepID=A0A4Y2K642_ARAVE|nr:Supervillin [Araneus ventricosus]